MNQIAPLAIPYESPRVQYALGAVPPAAFAIPWKFWTLDQDLAAVIVDAGGHHTLVNGTDFTVTGNAPADPNASYYDGGTLTLLASYSNCSLTLWRIPLLRRLYDISLTGPLDVKMLNAQLDQYMTTMQDLKLRLDGEYGRDYTELGNNFPAFTLPTPFDGMLLGWSGQNLINMAPNAVAYGPAGPTGPTGPSGNAGALGPTGPASTAIGPTGPVGPVGSQGIPGAQGSPGVAGATGPTGPGNPYIVVANLVTNPPDVNNPPVNPPTGLLVADTSVADFTGYPAGPTGPTGPAGSAGIVGPVGPGVPTGGTTAQALVKNTAANFDTIWSGPFLALTGGTLTGALTLAADPAAALGAATKQYADKMLPLAGGTLTGNLVCSGPLGILIDTAAATPHQIAGRTSGSLRWLLALGNGAAETGSNVGSDLQINRYSDAGVMIDAPLSINRQSGNVTLTGVTTTLASGGHALLTMNKGAGAFTNAITGQRATVARWNLQLGDATAESSGNLGSDFSIGRFNDAGTIIDTSLVITRSTGVVSLNASGLKTVGTGVNVGGRGISYGQYAGNYVAFQWASPNLSAWVDNTNLGNITVTSDYRIKKDIAPLPSMWERAKTLKPISYRHKDYTPKGASEPLIVGDDKERWGFVAHELQETLIEDAAHGTKDEENVIQSPNPWTIIATLTKTLQEAMARIEAIEEKLP